MFGPGGFSYVYLCYGVHHLFNVVSNIEGIPHAILIRNMVPIMGLDTMLKRRGGKNIKLTGPGTLTQAMGIDKSHNAISLHSEKLRIEDHNIRINADNIIETPRIGVDYAGEDAKLRYRFVTQII